MAIDNKDKKVLNVPHLRFPEFSGKWKKCTLGDITINFNLRNKEKIELPMYSVTNNRGFIPQSEQFEDRDMVGEDIKAYKIIHNKDFAYNPARINVGSIAKYNGSKPCMISSLYVCFKAANGIDEDWLMHLLRSPKIQYYYNINGEGGVRIYLFYPNFARIRTSFPTIAEQRKIANLLSLLDARITTQNKIIEDLKKLKSAISKKLLCNDKWTTYKIQDIAEIGRGRVISSVEIEKQRHPLYPVYSSQTSNDGIMGYLDNYMFDGEYITWTTDGANAGTVFYRNGKFNCTNVCGTLKIHLQFDCHFVSLVLQQATQKYVSSNLANPKLMNNTMASIKIRMPDMETQKRLSKVFQTLDSRLLVHQCTYEMYLREKQYLLNQMFI